MRALIIAIFIIFFVSCDYLKLKPKKENHIEKPAVASVGETKLYISDIKNVVPEGMALQDSIVLIKSYINTWAKQQLLLQKSKENITEKNSKEIDALVKKYREGLFINNYKERLIKQQLDTVVSDDKIVLYYTNNKSNFKLNEELIQLKFIYFGNDFLDKKEVIEKFKSTKEEDFEALENLTINFKDYQLRDSTWMSIDKVMLRIPPFREEPKQNLLKISKFIQKEDSLGVYLVAVKKVLKRNDIAPLSYIKNNIKALILHKRKLELIREIEKTLINDAIKNNNFKEY